MDFLIVLNLSYVNWCCKIVYTHQYIGTHRMQQYNPTHFCFQIFIYINRIESKFNISSEWKSKPHTGTKWMIFAVSAVFPCTHTNFSVPKFHSIFIIRIFFCRVRIFFIHCNRVYIYIYLSNFKIRSFESHTNINAHLHIQHTDTHEKSNLFVQQMKINNHLSSLGLYSSIYICIYLF